MTADMHSPQQEFLTKIPETPLLDQVGKQALKTFDDICNAVIEKAGACVTLVVEKAKECKGSIMNVGSGSSESPTCNAPTIAQGKNEPSQGLGKTKQIERDGIEVSQKLAKDVEAVGAKQSISKSENISQADLCTFSPMQTPSCNVNQAQGRGSMSM